MYVYSRTISQVVFFGKFKIEILYFLSKTKRIVKHCVFVIVADRAREAINGLVNYFDTVV